MTARRIQGFPDSFSDNIEIKEIGDDYIIFLDKEDGKEVVIKKENIEDFEGIKSEFRQG